MGLNWEFMQDNDPKHASKLVKKWFQEQKVNVMEWPAQSPDWGVLKNKIGDFKPKNKDEL